MTVSAVTCLTKALEFAKKQYPELHLRILTCYAKCAKEPAKALLNESGAAGLDRLFAIAWSYIDSQHAVFLADKDEETLKEIAIRVASSDVALAVAISTQIKNPKFMEEVDKAVIEYMDPANAIDLIYIYYDEKRRVTLQVHLFWVLAKKDPSSLYTKNLFHSLKQADNKLLGQEGCAKFIEAAALIGELKNDPRLWIERANIGLKLELLASIMAETHPEEAFELTYTPPRKDKVFKTVVKVTSANLAVIKPEVYLQYLSVEEILKMAKVGACNNPQKALEWVNKILSRLNPLKDGPLYAKTLGVLARLDTEKAKSLATEPLDHFYIAKALYPLPESEVYFNKILGAFKKDALIIIARKTFKFSLSYFFSLIKEMPGKQKNELLFKLIQENLARPAICLKLADKINNPRLAAEAYLSIADELLKH
jgi:hypothetical protein